MSKKFLTVKETTEILNISRTTLYDWIKKGKIKSYKRTGRDKETFFSADEVEKLQGNSFEERKPTQHRRAS